MLPILGNVSGDPRGINSKINQQKISKITSSHALKDFLSISNRGDLFLRSYWGLFPLISIVPLLPESDLSRPPLILVVLSKTLRLSLSKALALRFARYPTMMPRSFRLSSSSLRRVEIYNSNWAFVSSFLAISFPRLSMTFSNFACSSAWDCSTEIILFCISLALSGRWIESSSSAAKVESY